MGTTMADTAPTTTNNPVEPDRQPPWPTIAILGAFAVVMIALAVPRLIGSIAMLGGDNGVRAMTIGYEVDDATLESIIASRRGGLAWFNSGRAYVEGARAAVVLAGRLRDRPYPPV